MEKLFFDIIEREKNGEQKVIYEYRHMHKPKLSLVDVTHNISEKWVR